MNKSLKIASVLLLIPINYMHAAQLPSASAEGSEKSIVLFQDLGCGEEYNSVKRGQKLAKLFLLNYHLSSKQDLLNANSSLAVPINEEPYEFNFELAQNSAFKPVNGELMVARKESFFKPTTSFKTLSLLALLTSSLIPTAQAGPVLCAVCITGCCAALGQIEGPICVLHCSAGPCGAFCLAPTL